MKPLRVVIASLLLLAFSGSSTNAGSQRYAQVDFYGHPIQMVYDFALHHLPLTRLDQKEFNRNVQQFRNNTLQQSAKQVQQLAQQFRLDDIGLSVMLDKFIDQYFSAEQPNRKTFVKYMFLKEMGYDVLLTRTGNRLNCMGNLSFTPGRYIFIQYNRKTYKDLDFRKRNQGGRHFIFMDRKQTYKVLSRNSLQLPRINARTRRKELAFTHQQVPYAVSVRSNQSLVEFLEDIPMYDIGNEYTRLSMSQEMKSSLIAYLKQQTQAMLQVEKVKFLLSFVQQVVPYGSDYTKYGEERYYYPEQTVMAATADCEDKTFLLAYLAREIAGVSSVALYFENDEHLSIGLKIPNYSDSYSFKYKGQYYVACEPTAQIPRLGKSAFSLNRVTKVTPL